MQGQHSEMFVGFEFGWHVLCKLRVQTLLNAALSVANADWLATLNLRFKNARVVHTQCYTAQTIVSAQLKHLHTRRPSCDLAWGEGGGLH